jgi:hypothetical protein
MTRRRVALALLLAALVFGCIIFRPDRLTDEERRYLGTWKNLDAGVGEIEFFEDRRYVVEMPTARNFSPQIGYWRVIDGELVLDREPSAFRRTFRPLLVRLGVRVELCGPVKKGVYDVDGNDDKAPIRRVKVD